jgi:hypothetical protein
LIKYKNFKINKIKKLKDIQIIINQKRQGNEINVSKFLKISKKIIKKTFKNSIISYIVVL